MKKLNVLIATPKFSFIKYKDNGKIDYISPIPFTVNYGNIPEMISAEGDKADAFILGKRIKKEIIKEVMIVGKIDFYDRGIYDPKYICSDRYVSLIDKINVIVFFTLFSFAKKILNKLRGKKGKTKLVKIDFFKGYL
jgi:inorganic pyrophosphatase